VVTNRARGSPVSRPKRERELAFHDVAVDRQDAEAHAVGAPAEGLPPTVGRLGSLGSTRVSPRSTCCPAAFLTVTREKPRLGWPR
jgi:hypothetical protein